LAISTSMAPNPRIWASTVITNTFNYTYGIIPMKSRSNKQFLHLGPRACCFA
jgi:hypothetical protein